MTTQALKKAPSEGSDTDAAAPPAYVVVLARLLVESALRTVHEGGAANDNESTLVVREEQ